MIEKAPLNGNFINITFIELSKKLSKSYRKSYRKLLDKKIIKFFIYYIKIYRTILPIYRYTK